MLRECPECWRKVSSDADVCPYCGYNLSTRRAKVMNYLEIDRREKEIDRREKEYKRWEAALINCPECGRVISSEYKKCSYCGCDLSKRRETRLRDCPDCGYKVSYRAESCPRCGLKLSMYRKEEFRRQKAEEEERRKRKLEEEKRKRKEAVEEALKNGRINRSGIAGFVLSLIAIGTLLILFPFSVLAGLLVPWIISLIGLICSEVGETGKKTRKKYSYGDRVTRVGLGINACCVGAGILLLGLFGLLLGLYGAILVA